MPVSMVYPRCNVVAWPLLLRTGGTPLELLGLPEANTPVARQMSTLAHQSCTPEDIYPPPTGLWAQCQLVFDHLEELIFV